jgi:hypothetical protein
VKISRKKRSKTPPPDPNAETTLSLLLPKQLAVAAWNEAAADSLTFEQYVIKLLLEDNDRLQEEKAKIITFPKANDCT